MAFDIRGGQRRNNGAGKCAVNTLSATIIECPECRTRYELPLAIPEKGRKVRCSKCAFVWVAMPLAPEPEPDAPGGLDDDIVMSDVAEPEAAPDAAAPPPPVPAAPAPAAVSAQSMPGPAPAPAEPEALGTVREARVSDIYEAEPQEPPSIDADLDIEFAASEFSAAVEHDDAAPPASAEGARPRRGFPAGLAAGWLLLLAAAGGVAYGAIAGREQVVALLPGAAGIYERLGLPVNVRGLEFRKVAYDWSAVAGRQLLEVTGEVVNISDRPRPVPAIEIALRDAGNAEVYQWSEEIRSAPLEAGQATAFRASLDSPPAGVVNLQVRFARAQ